MKKEILFYNSLLNYRSPKNKIKAFKRKFKYISRNIFYYKYFKEIIDFILDNKYLKDEVYKYPVLCSKVHRPYITNIFNKEEKLKIIKSSYKFLENKFNENFLKQLYREMEIKICEVEGKNEEKLSFYINAFTTFDKEGEFSLICSNSQEEQLAKLTFAINEKDEILIGGLQGMDKDGDADEIKRATKNFYGLFPKRLVAEILYLLFPENKKYAVGNNGHIYLSLRYKFRKTINADYDEFWKSLGATKENKIFWSLPEEIVRKNIEDIESKKRSQYRSRYKILDELKELVKEFIDERRS